MKEIMFEGNYLKVTVEDGIERVYLRGSVHTFLITEDNKIRLTLERRLGSDELREKIQGGIVETNEAPLATAKRELYEELGMEAGEWEEFLIQDSSGAVNDTRHYYIAKGLCKVTDEIDGEIIETKDYTLKELYEKAMNGQFSPMTQAAIARLHFSLSEGLEL